MGSRVSYGAPAHHKLAPTHEFARTGIRIVAAGWRTTTPESRGPNAEKAVEVTGLASVDAARSQQRGCHGSVETRPF